MMLAILIAGLFLAFSNGANDNFKGVATLLGSRTTNYKTALVWASITTFAGSLAAFFLAKELMINFLGKGLVPDHIVQLASFSISVAVAAAITVFLATRFGFPISTTHAITGGLVGAGALASGGAINVEKLMSTFFLPLLISPFVAIIGAIAVYPTFRFFRNRFGVTRKSCICIGNEVIMTAPQGFVAGPSAASIQFATIPQISVGTNVVCQERYVGQVWGVSAKMLIDIFHFISAGMVGFARGLNDTPKIAAILLVGQFIDPMLAIGLVAVAMCIGGLVFAKKIAETMSYNITDMNDGQGLSANLVTSMVVIGASQFGVPVSTTHVSCGSLFGIGAVTKKAHWKAILKIVMAWVITLPVAGVIGCLAFAILREIL